MRVSLIAMACVGVFGFNSMSSISYAGEKEWIIEEDVGKSFLLVEFLDPAPDLGTPSTYKKPEDKVVEQDFLRKADSTGSFSAVPDSYTPSNDPKKQNPTDYKVAPGDTLIGIARILDYPKTDRTRVVVALWKTNQSNFIDGNLNGIIAGKVLQLQNLKNTLAELDSKSAYSIIQSQWQEWKNRGTKAAATGKNESDAVEKNATVTEDTGKDKTAAVETPQDQAKSTAADAHKDAGKPNSDTDSIHSSSNNAEGKVS